MGHLFDDDPEPNADSVADEVAPHEVEPQDQPAQRGVPDRVDPGGMVQLADLDQHGERDRQQFPATCE